MNVETNGLYETFSLMEFGMEPDNTLQIIDGMTIYPSCVFHPYDYVSSKTYVEQDTFAIHHFYGTWMEKEDWLCREQTKKEYRNILDRMGVAETIEGEGDSHQTMTV